MDPARELPGPPHVPGLREVADADHDALRNAVAWTKRRSHSCAGSRSTSVRATRIARPWTRRAGSKPSAAEIVDERRGAAASLDEPRAVDLDHRVPNDAPRQVNGAAGEHARLRALDVDLHQVDALDAPVVQAVIEPPHRNLDGRPVRPSKQRRVVVASSSRREGRAARPIRRARPGPSGRLRRVAIAFAARCARSVANTTGLGSTAITRPSRPTRSAAISEK